MVGSKLVRIVLNLSLVVVSLLLAFVMVEGSLRIAAYFPVVLMPPYLFANHPSIGWTLRPNFSATINTPEGPVAYAVNSQGIRAPHDFSRNPGPLLRRVFIIGDSFPFGTSVNEEYTFPRLLNDRMKSRHLLMEFINLGVPGFGTIHSYERLLEYSDMLGVPHTVIYVFCPNDPVDNVAGKREVVNGIRIDSHRRNKFLLSYIAKGYNEIRLIALLVDFYYSHFENLRKFKRQELIRQDIDVEDREDFILSTRYLSKMISWAEQNNVNFLVVTTSHSQYSQPLKKMLIARETPIIEADEIFSEFNVNNEPLFLFDGIHWNKQGHKLVADGIEEFLFRLYPLASDIRSGHVHNPS
jgi:hypothetical protein